MTRVWKAVAASLLPLVAASFAATGQLSAAPIPQDQDKFANLRDEKMALEVFKKADWTFDYDAARERAKKESKVIFTYFTRSYAG